MLSAAREKWLTQINIPISAAEEFVRNYATLAHISYEEAEQCLPLYLFEHAYQLQHKIIAPTCPVHSWAKEEYVPDLLQKVTEILATVRGGSIDTAMCPTLGINRCEHHSTVRIQLQRHLLIHSSSYPKHKCKRVSEPFQQLCNDILRFPNYKREQERKKHDAQRKVIQLERIRQKEKQILTSTTIPWRRKRELLHECAVKQFALDHPMFPQK